VRLFDQYAMHTYTNHHECHDAECILPKVVNINVTYLITSIEINAGIRTIALGCPADPHRCRVPMCENDTQQGIATMR
jgi:hypothetical protein